MAKNRRHYVPCRECGNEHRNPASSSICNECGPAYAIRNLEVKAEQERVLNIEYNEEEVLAKKLCANHLKLSEKQMNTMWEEFDAHYKHAWSTIAEKDLE